MSNTTPTRPPRGVNVPFIDTTKSFQDSYGSAVFHAGCLTPPQSAHDYESRRGSLPYGSLSDAGYSGIHLAHTMSLPVTPLRDMTPTGHHWRQCTSIRINDGNGASAEYFHHRPHNDLQGCMLLQPNRESMQSAMPLQSNAFHESDDTKMEDSWPHVRGSGWNAHDSPVHVHDIGLSSALFQDHPSLGPAPQIEGANHHYATHPLGGLQMNTPCVGSFHSSIDPCYSQGQPTVVPSQLGDQYVVQPYSAYSSPNGGHESANTSFATANTTFDSFESTAPPTPEDVYGCRAGDDWELVKAEDLSPGPGMLSHGYHPAPNQGLPHRPRRKNAKRSKARQPRECFTWPNEDGITCEVEGKLCGVGYEIDPVTKRVRYPGISKQLKPHPCNMLDGKTGLRCSARFDRSEHLKRHQAKHSDVRQYMCPLPECTHQKGIGRGDNAKDHFKTHLKSTAKGRRNKQFFWPQVKKALLLKFQDEKVSNNLISNIERWIRTSRDAACQRNRYGEPLTEDDAEYLQRLYGRE